MTTHIPTISICNLFNEFNNVQDCVVLDLQGFISEKPDLVTSPHRHSFYQILFITDGTGKHFIDFKTHIIQKGDLFFLVPGQIHKWIFDTTTKGLVINFNHHFFSSFLARTNYLDDFPFFIGNGEYSKVSLEHQFADIQQIFTKIQNEYKTCNECSWDLLRLYLLELFIISNRAINAENKIQTENKHQLLLLRNFERLVEENYKTKKLPKDYAEMLFVTPNHLNALCQKIKGISAGELIRNRILLETKRLLVNSSLTISEISYKLNYQDNSYFSRFFKKNTGITPEDFRNSKYV